MRDLGNNYYTDIPAVLRRISPTGDDPPKPWRLRAEALQRPGAQGVCLLETTGLPWGSMTIMDFQGYRSFFHQHHRGSLEPWSEDQSHHHSCPDLFGLPRTPPSHRQVRDCRPDHRGWYKFHQKGLINYPVSLWMGVAAVIGSSWGEPGSRDFHGPFKKDHRHRDGRDSCHRDRPAETRAGKEEAGDPGRTYGAGILITFFIGVYGGFTVPWPGPFCCMSCSSSLTRPF